MIDLYRDPQSKKVSIKILPTTTTHSKNVEAVNCMTDSESMVLKESSKDRELEVLRKRVKELELCIQSHTQQSKEKELALSNWGGPAQITSEMILSGTDASLIVEDLRLQCSTSSDGSTLNSIPDMLLTKQLQKHDHDSGPTNDDEPPDDQQ